MSATRRIRPAVYAAAIGMTVCMGFAGLAAAHDFDIEVPGLDPIVSPVAEGATLFQNVRVFDGSSPELSQPSNVLVPGNTIERISTGETEAAGARIVAGDGCVLMPGLIDAHWHAFMAATPHPILITAEPSYLHHGAAQEAEATLMRGFTTILGRADQTYGRRRRQLSA
jgi:imidazolonepropionase-like amidohydrolase